MDPLDRMRMCVLGLTLLFTIFVPAEAEGQAAPCGDKACMWLDANYSGCVYAWDGTSTKPFKELRYQNCPDRSVNDSVSSVLNNSDSHLFLFEDDSQNGRHVCIAPGSRQNLPRELNDRLSSARSNFYYNQFKPPPECH
jgi:hypothetical protein